MSKVNRFGIVFLVSYLTLLAGFMVYRERYDLGLAKPKFAAGDCVRQVNETEFYSTYSYILIKEVGKKEYLGLDYYLAEESEETGPARAYGTGRARGVRYVDQNTEKTECPSKIFVRE